MRFLAQLLLLTSLLLIAPPAMAQNVSGDGDLVSINGTEIFVRRMGEGEPIVVIHGGPVLEHGYFLPYLEPLAKDYELIFFDQRLSGRSAGEVPKESVRVTTFVDDIEALRTTLKLGKIHVMGHSWGGHLAMRYAIRFGDQIRSLMLLNSMSADSESWVAEQKLLMSTVSDEDQQAMNDLRQSEAFKLRRIEALHQMLMLSYAPQFHDRDKVADLRINLPADYMERSRQFGAMTTDLQQFDLGGDLERLKMPTLVLYGAAEPSALRSGKALHETIPGSEFVSLPRAGHFPFVEQPDAFVDAIRLFLRHAK